MFKHIHVIINDELDRITKWIDTVLWSGSNTKAWNVLQEARKEWKIYYSWCDNMTQDWSCWWHENKEKKLWQK